MDKFKKEMTRHESITPERASPSAVNVELLFRQVAALQQEVDQWRAYSQHLECCNKSTNEINDSLLSKVTILEDVL